MKRLIVGFFAILAAVAFTVSVAGCDGAKRDYVLTEDTFFLVMTNMIYYPEQYLDSRIQFDCFTYTLVDVDGKAYTCGVRKCSAGYGCTCGKDTIIGFILDYDGDIPAPKNQSEDTPDKTWIHLDGKLASAQKTDIRIYAYIGEEIDHSTIETISFYTFKAEKLTVIEDYSSLNYYVTK